MIWYSVPDAARVARVPERTLRRAVENGDLPARKVSARRQFVWWDDVVEWRTKRSLPEVLSGR